MCVLRLWFAIAFLRSLYVTGAADFEEQNSTDSETASPAPAWHKWPGTRVCPRSTNMLCNRHVLSRTCVCVKIQETVRDSDSTRFFQSKRLKQDSCERKILARHK